MNTTTTTTKITARNRYDVLGTEVEDLLAAEGTELGRVSGDSGSGAPPHAHPWRETFWMLTGSMNVLVDGLGVTQVAAGEGISAPAGVVHAFTFTEDGSSCLVVSHSDRLMAFFAELSAAMGEQPDLAEAVRIAARHQVTIQAP